MQDFEKLGVFYLGREFDLASRSSKPELLLYDSKDLTTHAVCVGMTGSGKTGLCVALLEEAAIDGVPAIVIDPKGDLSNLLLTFPQLRPEDFLPWVDPADATRKGITPAELAATTADTWRKGLEGWGEDGARIERLRASADFAIYTPGSTAGLPLTVLRSFTAPPAAVLADGDALRERVAAAAAGLLALIGVDADPIRSREQILLAQLLEQTWRGGRDLDLGGLVRGIQSPPFEQVGVVDLETFYPAKERFELAMRLNNLLASPSFSGWLEGEALDVGRLLHTGAGKPRISVLSIAHLSDAERMFFVTILLNEVIAWMRAQQGTSSLRAILYMDEVFGYFPPTANPPSKMPMLTLLKQARAFGLGIVLATQNPVDLDYKGLSNAGTWFLGRLQTERDKMRVLDGLEGASAAAGETLDRGEMAAALAGLGSRVFLMNNVHENAPRVFESRWCMSYLRGPMTREQIGRLMAERKTAERGEAPAAGSPPTGSAGAASTGSSERPLIPSEIRQVFVRLPGSRGGDYRPALYGTARLHFVDAKAGVDLWHEGLVLVAPMDEASDAPWDEAQRLTDRDADVSDEPQPGAKFAPLPGILAQAKSYARWQKDLAAFLYRTETLTLWSAPACKMISQPDENEGAFRVRVSQRVREDRDGDLQKLRQKYAAKIATLDSQMRRAQERIAREEGQSSGQILSTVISIGSSLAKIFTSRKTISSTNIGSAASAAKSASRAAQQHGDIGRAKAELEALSNKRADLEAQIQAEIDHLEAPAAQEVVEYRVRPRKTDVIVTGVMLAWV